MDKYKIIQKIAAGGMAEVFLARSTAAMGLGKFVAIKKILPDLSESPDFIDMFKAEARVAMQLQHRNLISIYDFGTVDGQCFLVMELVHGLNLSQILREIQKKKGQLPMAMALYLIAEAASGLYSAHDITIHRDISPANIMISYSGEIKVIDFGVAKVRGYGEETQAGVLKGKINYMSPEQINCEKLDHRSDIFSLGLVLYEVLTGCRGYKGRDQEIQPIQELNHHVGTELIACVQKSLSPSLDQRFQTMDDFSRELRGILNKNYPEFTPTELAEFMKKEFFQHYQNLQNRLCGYETDQAAGLGDEAPTEITKSPMISSDVIEKFESKFLFKVRKKFRIQSKDDL